MSSNRPIPVPSRPDPQVKASDAAGRPRPVLTSLTSEVTTFPRVGLGQGTLGARHPRSGRCGCGGSRSPPDGRCPRHSYGVDVPAMLFQLHEWDIHIVCRYTDDASGAGGEAADDPPHQVWNFRHTSLQRDWLYPRIGLSSWIPIVR